MIFSRREFLRENAMGVGTVALACLLNKDDLLATPKDVPKHQRTSDLRMKRPHFEPCATAMISLFQHGGPSHMDLTDPKPELTKYDGNDYQGSVQYSFANNASKKLLGTKWKFAKHGECGTELSNLLPHTAEIASPHEMNWSPHTCQFQSRTSRSGS